MLILTAAFFLLDHHYGISLQKDLLVDQPTEVEELVEVQSPYRSLGYPLLATSALSFWFFPAKYPVPWKSPGLWAFACYILWCYASVVWSDDPATTIRRLIPLTLLAITALGWARHVAIEHTWVLGWLVPAIHLFIGLFAELHLGTLRPWQADFRLVGTIHPNTLGLQTAILILAIVCAVPWRRGYRGAAVVLGLLALVSLILTKSRTALGGLVVALLAIWLPTAPQLVQATLALFGPFCATLFVLYGLLAEGSVAGISRLLLMGRTEEVGTLTGRLPLWEHLAWYIRERPWLGYGYGGFWTPQRTLKISQSQDWVIAHAHNAFLELVLNIGLIGLGLMLLAAGMALGKAYYHFLFTRHGRHWKFVCGLGALAIVFSLTEGVFAQHGFAMFCLMCSCASAWAYNAPCVTVPKTKNIPSETRVRSLAMASTVGALKGS
jgi:O-antigen ligase